MAFEVDKIIYIYGLQAKNDKAALNVFKKLRQRIKTVIKRFKEYCKSKLILPLLNGKSHSFRNGFNL